MEIETQTTHDDDPERAVTAADYRALALDANHDVEVAGALAPQLQLTSHPPLWKAGDPWLFAGIDRSRGNVSVIVVPDADKSVDTPQPTLELLRAVQAFLDQRRVLTNRLAVLGPRYLPITVVADVLTKKSAIDKGKVKPGELAAAVAKNIQRYLHPVHGGEHGKGWEVGQSVDIAALQEAIAPDSDLGAITALTVTAAVPLYHFPPLGPGGSYDPVAERPALALVAGTVQLADYELVCWDRAGSHVNDKGSA
jgi:hypothetical protein